MKPILYKAEEVDFNSNGLGKLEALSSKVIEVANGEFELEVVYPTSGILFNDIDEHMQIKAKPNDLDDDHIFVIYDYEIDTVSQTVSIFASTITNKLGNNLVRKVTVSNQTPQNAMNLMKNNLVEPTSFDFISDIQTKSSTEWVNRNPLNCIAGEQGSLIQHWGGEIKRDNRTVYLYKRRGNDNVATIREGRNLNGLTILYSIKGLVTKIVPFRKYTPKDSEEEITEYGTAVESQYINNYPDVYVKAVDYSQDDTVTSLATMNQKASKYFTENSGIDKPSINVNMNLVDLSSASEYKDFKDFEKIGLFDTVTVYSKKYNLLITAKVTRIEYDSMNERNITLEMGSFQTGLMEDVERDYTNIIRDIETEVTNVIQRAANGKNKVYRGVDEPKKGMVKNDLWYKPVGDGETMLYNFDGAYWKLEKVSAGLLGGTLDAENGDVNLINVNVANIVGETSNFVRSAWNGINSHTDVDGSGLKVTHNDGSYTRLGAGGIMRYTSADNRNYHYLISIHTFIYGESSNNARWIQLPSDFKGKNFKVYFAIADSMNAIDYRRSIQRFVCTTHPDHNVDYTNARVPVISYKSETLMDGNEPAITNVQGMLIAIY